jgi:hypothetical protein
MIISPPTCKVLQLYSCTTRTVLYDMIVPVVYVQPYRLSIDTTASSKISYEP